MYSMEALTKVQHNALMCLKHFKDVHGYMPTYAEWADRLGYKSANAVLELAVILERKGYISRELGKARRITIND